MTPLPQLYPNQRAPRARLATAAPAVLRFQDGHRASANLCVLSLTGGLLTVPSPLLQGAEVKLMFLTGAGSVLGRAEMLTPVANTLQPFRFIALTSDARRRVGATIQAELRPENQEPQWIAKFRAASEEQELSWWRRFKLLALVFGLATSSLAGAMHFLHVQWR
jgi:hypothetical protein